MTGIWQTAALAVWAIDLGSRNFRILWTTLPIIGLILLGAGIIAAAKRWYERPRPLRLGASEQLAHFRSLYEKGSLSAEEFARLQSVLGERIKRELDIPAAPSGPAAPQSSATPATTATETPGLPPAAVPSANGHAPPQDPRDLPGPHDPQGR